MKYDLKHIAGLLKEHGGVDILSYESGFIEKALGTRLSVTHYSTFLEYQNFLEGNPEEAKTFLESINISYSEFFRNNLTFSVLERIILPQLIHLKKKSRRKEIRIWSTACASGQEAYSLAMILEDVLSLNGEKINYRIFATDHSEVQVSMAQEGHYSKELVTNITLKRLDNWFIKSKDLYAVRPELKSNIDFSVFDLFDTKLDSPTVSIFGDFDIVVCANLLFYYKSKDQNGILKKLSSCLSNEGFLITGETEREIAEKNRFFEVYPQSAIFRYSHSMQLT